MKRYLPLVMLVAILVLSVSACSPSKLIKGNETTTEPISSGSDTVTNAAAGSETTIATESSKQETTITTESSKQEATTETEKMEDSGITLESVKQAALDAGYAAEDIKDLSQNTVPIPVRGIYVNYADEKLQSQCPVYEFKNNADAKEYARQVNDSGYGLCIINGKLLAMTDSKYGIILNENEKAVLESFLKSSFLAYEEPAPPKVSNNKDYAGDSTRIDAIHQALDKLVNKAVLLYGKSLPAGETKNFDFISFSMVGSSDLSFTSPLCEDQTKIDSVIQTWKLYGCTNVEIKHNAAHEYTMTGKRAGMDESFTINCLYSPDKDSLRIVDINGKELSEFFEFVPLGNDQYAFQTKHERAIIGYKDGKITSIIYSLNPQTNESGYVPGADSIYPNGKGVDNAWASKAGKDKYEQFIEYDGVTLHVSAKDFTGSKLTAEITTK